MTPRRPTTARRGYGSVHQTIRARWAPRVATGTVPCARCGLVISTAEPWDLGHDDADRSRYSGPEHRACNRARPLIASPFPRRSVRRTAGRGRATGE